jgi:hypothetical protein
MRTKEIPNGGSETKVLFRGISAKFLVEVIF